MFFFNIKEVEEVKGPSKEMAIEFIKNVSEKYGSTGIKKEAPPSIKQEKTVSKGKKGEEVVTAKTSNMMGLRFDPVDSYSECYPGTNAEEDVNIDSDDEADYSQMDAGSKKGPLNRWDFASNEEYGNYMNNKEALPKAAFQFGQKLGDGRKTRREGGPGAGAGDKNKIDKEWNQISKLIEKRKAGDYEADYKKPKY
jgi:IK cytokine